MLLNVHSATLLASILLGVFVIAHPLGHRQLDSPHDRSQRVARFVASACFETAFVCALFALWQVANGLTRGHTTGGLQRGRSLYHFERVIHLPTELSAQNLIIGHPTIVRAANYYYDSAHLTLMVTFLIWMWLRHRDRYPFFRNMVVSFTGMSLLIQMISVAPPRLIGGTGLVDTAAYYHQSVYGTAIGSALADQYAAMPSIHVGWAMLISFAIFSASPSWFRWVAALYGPLTFYVVVATANHYWMDGIAATALVAVSYAIARGIEALQQRILVRAPRAEPAQIQQGAFS